MKGLSLATGIGRCSGKAGTAHGEDYVYEAVCAAGFRVLRIDRPAIRQEAGTDVPGLLFAVERIQHDG